jgi:hypothetical protein
MFQKHGHNQSTELRDLLGAQIYQCTAQPYQKEVTQHFKLKFMVAFVVTPEK